MFPWWVSPSAAFYDGKLRVGYQHTEALDNKTYTMWYSVYDGTSWSRPQPMGSDEAPIAKDSSPCLSVDDKALWVDYYSASGYSGRHRGKPSAAGRVGVGRLGPTCAQKRGRSFVGQLSSVARLPFAPRGRGMHLSSHPRPSRLPTARALSRTSGGKTVSRDITALSLQPGLFSGYLEMSGRRGCGASSEYAKWEAWLSSRQCPMAP